MSGAEQNPATAMETRLKAVEDRLSFYRTASIVLGFVFTGILGITAKQAYDAARTQLNPALSANAQAEAILSSIRTKEETLELQTTTFFNEQERNFKKKFEELVIYVEEGKTAKEEIVSIKRQYPFARFTVAKNEHPQRPSANGQYYSLDASVVEEEIGLQTGECRIFTTLNSRTGLVAPTIFWNEGLGVPGTNAHGRYTNQFGQKSEDWQAGDTVQILYESEGNC